MTRNIIILAAVLALLGACGSLGAWQLTIPDTHKVCVPVKGGAVYDSASPYDRYEWKYPVSLDLPFVIVMSGDAGGTLIYSRDRLRYAAVTLTHSEGRFTLDFDMADFAQKRFSGSWEDGAALYTGVFRASLPADLPRHPEWTDGVRMVVFDFGAPISAYETLAREVDPASVVIYYPDWRRDPYDVNYPDYTMSDRAADRIRQLKALGYRIMLHVNIFGVGYGHPLYKRFAPLQLRSRQTGELQAWTLSEDPIGYMNVASEEWQSFFTDCLKKIYADYAPDAVYLDQAYYTDPDSDPGDCELMRGAEALLRRIRRELPGLALGGEGTNGVVSPWLKFGSLIPLGIHHGSHYGDPRLIDAAAPVTARGLGKTDRFMWHNSIPWILEQYGSFMAFYDTQPVWPAISMEPEVDLGSAPARYSIALAKAGDDVRHSRSGDGVMTTSVKGKTLSLWSHRARPVYKGKKLEKDVYYYSGGPLWPGAKYKRPVYLCELPKRVGIENGGSRTLEKREGFEDDARMSGAAVIPDGAGYLVQLPYEGNERPAGSAALEFEVELPGDAYELMTWFDFGAPGLADKSDGFEARVTAVCGKETLEQKVYCREKTSFNMDLSPFAGKRVTLTITLSPGETVSYDFVRIETPGVIRRL
ncbi:MAG: hypothetical protein IK083_08915 [Abditibacteriota bacterium]|nr:hypothetical protein [Abditibacteriota bacterium]